MFGNYSGEPNDRDYEIINRSALLQRWSDRVAEHVARLIEMESFIPKVPPHVLIFCGDVADEPNSRSKPITSSGPIAEAKEVRSVDSVALSKSIPLTPVSRRIDSPKYLRRLDWPIKSAEGTRSLVLSDNRFRLLADLGLLEY